VDDSLQLEVDTLGTDALDSSDGLGSQRSGLLVDRLDRSVEGLIGQVSLETVEQLLHLTGVEHVPLLTVLVLLDAVREELLLDVVHELLELLVLDEQLEVRSRRRHVSRRVGTLLAAVVSLLRSPDREGETTVDRDGLRVLGSHGATPFC